MSMAWVKRDQTYLMFKKDRTGSSLLPADAISQIMCCVYLEGQKSELECWWEREKVCPWISTCEDVRTQIFMRQLDLLWAHTSNCEQHQWINECVWKEFSKSDKEFMCRLVVLSLWRNSLWIIFWNICVWYPTVIVWWIKKCFWRLYGRFFYFHGMNFHSLIFQVFH